MGQNVPRFSFCGKKKCQSRVFFVLPTSEDPVPKNPQYTRKIPVPTRKNAANRCT